MPPRGLRPSGLVLVDKPPGPSSFAVVRDQRRRTGARAGHAGTLDPFASGLLLVLLGASTRLARYLVGLDKRYLTDVDLSARTSTGDPEGARLDEREPPTHGELDERLAALRGDVELRVPAASAVKIAGERAYRLARRGVEVEMPVRRSTVHLLELVEYEGVVARLDLLVSTGTYVRAIADTLGGHCRTLRRTEVGPFSVDDADGERLLPPADALPFLPAVEVDAETAAAVRAGRAVDGPSPTGPVPGTRHGASGRGGAGTAAPGPDPTRPTRPWLVPGTGQGQEGRVRVVAAGELVAVARVDESVLRPETVLPA